MQASETKLPNDSRRWSGWYVCVAEWSEETDT